MPRDFTQRPGCSFAKMLLTPKASTQERELSFSPFNVDRTGLGTLLCFPSARTHLFWTLAACSSESLHAQPSSTAHDLASPALFSIRPCGCAHACHQLRCRYSALAQSRYLRRPTPLVSYNRCSCTCCFSQPLFFHMRRCSTLGNGCRVAGS